MSFCLAVLELQSQAKIYDFWQFFFFLAICLVVFPLILARSGPFVHLFN